MAVLSFRADPYDRWVQKKTALLLLQKLPLRRLPADLFTEMVFTILHGIKQTVTVVHLLI